MPRVVDDRWVDEHGTELARTRGSGHTGQIYEKGQSARFDRMNESGFWTTSPRGVFHPTVPELRLAAQDADGIVGEVIYGVLGAADSIADPDVQAAVMAAYTTGCASSALTLPIVWSAWPVCRRALRRRRPPSCDVVWRTASPPSRWR